MISSLAAGGQNTRLKSRKNEVAITMNFDLFDLAGNFT